MDYLVLLWLLNVAEEEALQLHEWERHCALEDEIRGFNQDIQIPSLARTNTGKFGSQLENEFSFHFLPSFLPGINVRTSEVKWGGAQT